jgi:folylpolyglutamate synthase/dihydropteroate synthase
MQVLNQWLEKILTQHPIEKMNFGLCRVWTVANRLDLLNLSCPVIVVAGTN